MKYTITLLCVTGMYTTGKYAHTGKMTFCKRDNLTSAKEAVSEEFKRGYYNYASIYDKENNTTIERFTGQEWQLVS